MLDPPGSYPGKGNLRGIKKIKQSEYLSQKDKGSYHTSQTLVVKRLLE